METCYNARDAHKSSCSKHEANNKSDHETARANKTVKSSFYELIFTLFQAHMFFTTSLDASIVTFRHNVFCNKACILI